MTITARRALALLAVSAILAILTAPAAQADDDSYLSTLAAHGITSANGPGALIKVGHAICDSLSHGYTPAQDAMIVRDNWRGGADHGGLTPSGIPGAVNMSQASAWVNAAVVNYCPTPHPGGQIVGPGPFGVIPPAPGFNETPMNPGAESGPWPGAGGREFP